MSRLKISPGDSSLTSSSTVGVITSRRPSSRMRLQKSTAPSSGPKASSNPPRRSNASRCTQRPCNAVALAFWSTRKLERYPEAPRSNPRYKGITRSEVTATPNDLIRLSRYTSLGDEIPTPSILEKATSCSIGSGVANTQSASINTSDSPWAISAPALYRARRLEESTLRKLACSIPNASAETSAGLPTTISSIPSASNICWANSKNQSRFCSQSEISAMTEQENLSE